MAQSRDMTRRPKDMGKQVGNGLVFRGVDSVGGFFCVALGPVPGRAQKNHVFERGLTSWVKLVK